MQKSRTAVIVLNFNGSKLLAEYLPSVIKNSPEAEVLVADNNSTDESLEFLRKFFPQVSILTLVKNFGFTGGYNIALKKVQADFYVLLNSDVEVTPGWLNPMIDLAVSDPGIAAIQPKILSFKDKSKFEYAGAAGGLMDRFGYPFCRGRLFSELEADEGQYNEISEIFWATGACLFIRSSDFHAVGGFDDSFFAHMEEIDLCWRLKNKGRKIYYMPHSTVYHLGGGTLKKMSPKKTFLNFRNNLLTFTKNYPHNNLLFILFLRLLLDGIAGIKFFVEGHFQHTFSVIRAHYSFFFLLPKYLKIRASLKKDPRYQPSKIGMYKKNIVFDYFLKRKRNFRQLSKNDFY